MFVMIRDCQTIYRNRFPQMFKGVVAAAVVLCRRSQTLPYAGNPNLSPPGFLAAFSEEAVSAAQWVTCVWRDLGNVLHLIWFVLWHNSQRVHFLSLRVRAFLTRARTPVRFAFKFVPTYRWVLDSSTQRKFCTPYSRPHHRFINHHRLQ
jgi:hypothetical protein